MELTVKERTASSISCEPAPPLAADFPAFPVSWYLFCFSRDLRKGPFSKPFLGRRIVAYRTESGRVVAMEASCSHLGSDLGAGIVVGEGIRCPFHDWTYGANGRCTNIPAQANIPAFARQTVYPVEERNGMIFIFNAGRPAFPLPFFANCDPAELIPSRPFGAVLDCPWYMAGANAFDLQHFRAAHDRRLQGDPVTDRPHAYAFRASGRFRVAGSSLQDRLTRQFAGDEVTLGIVDWCGSLSFATAEFRRTSTFGLVAREPLEDGRVRVDVIVFARRSRSRWKQISWDRLNVAVRRLFIKKFLTADAIRLNGVRYNPGGFIEADRDMVSYLAWVAKVAASNRTSPGDTLECGDEVALRVNESTAREKCANSLEDSTYDAFQS
jgi:phenylpropionate dioxygenase-like ring-hydroxylating dioxygenase large terminal subunit